MMGQRDGSQREALRGVPGAQVAAARSTGRVERLVALVTHLREVEDIGELFALTG